MISNFSACWAFSAQQEGGYTSNPADPGNWTGGACGVGVCTGTAFGISAAAYPHMDIKALTEAQAGIIMKADYWDKVNGDELPAGIDLVVFDFGINAGPGTSAMQLQGLLRVEQDCDIGPVTLAALARHDPAWVIAALTLSHQAYYRRLPAFGEFGNGWIARTVRCQAAAGQMVRAAAAA
ncbi:MAG TPA: glycosyl hydrolase 108 family protein [Acidocella sp.]|jgi:lysozyme family protein|nr:glycosyl hydrolase 108 family protein [Acidocella sp.]